MGEAPGRSILGQLCEAHDHDRTLLHRRWAAVIVNIGSDITGTGRVDLDLGLAQVVCKIYGEHIESGFGSVVAEDFRVIEGRAGITIDRK